MSTDLTAHRSNPTPVLLLVGLILLACALRIWRLGHWGLEGDEVFTLHDSINPRLDNPRPLIYFLNYYVVRPFVPLDELGVRLLPAFFGVLAVPALYLVGRRLVGTRAAFLSALLLTFNPLHVYQSQYARYWSLVFLLSAIYPFAIYLGLRDRRPGWTAFGVAIAVFAVLAHPVSLFLLGGLGLWMLTQARRDDLTRLWARPQIRWASGLIGFAGVLLAVRYVPLLRDWVFTHDDNSRLSDHLLTLPRGALVKQAGLLLAYTEGLTLPLVLTGLLGVYLLWLRGERSLATLLVCLLVAPVAAILLISLRTSVSTTYILSTAPVFFIGAGVLLDRIAGLDWELRPRWLLAAAVAAVIVAAGAPTLISQYKDGRRQDFRGAARWLDTHISRNDIVFSDQFRTVGHYLNKVEPRHLTADPDLLAKALRSLRQSGAGGSLWIVAPYSARGGHRTTSKLDDFKEWLYENCQLREAVGVARLDFRQNELQIYRCPPAPVEAGDLAASAAPS